MNARFDNEKHPSNSVREEKPEHVVLGWVFIIREDVSIAPCPHRKRIVSDATIINGTRDTAAQATDRHNLVNVSHRPSEWLSMTHHRNYLRWRIWDLRPANSATSATSNTFLLCCITHLHHHHLAKTGAVWWVGYGRRLLFAELQTMVEKYISLSYCYV